MRQEDLRRYKKLLEEKQLELFAKRTPKFWCRQREDGKVMSRTTRTCEPRLILPYE